MNEPVTARERLEEGMHDECLILRASPDPPTLDEETGVVTPAEPDEVYAGPCMVGNASVIVREILRGGEQEYVIRYPVSIPFDAGPVAIGDTVVLTESVADPDLPGQRLAVAAVVYGTRAARRRLTCELIKVGPR